MRFWHRHLPAELCICHKKSLVATMEAAAATQLALSGLGTLAECNGRIAGQLSGVGTQLASQLAPSCLHPPGLAGACDFTRGGLEEGAKVDGRDPKLWSNISWFWGLGWFWLNL